MRALEGSRVYCPPGASLYLLFNQQIRHTLTATFITCSSQGFGVILLLVHDKSKDAPLTTKPDLLINSGHSVPLQNAKAISDNSRMIPTEQGIILIGAQSFL